MFHQFLPFYGSRVKEIQSKPSLIKLDKFSAPILEVVLEDTLMKQESSFRVRL